MEQLEFCPVCNKDKAIPFLSCKDYTVSRETFSIQQCVSCGFKFTNPRPNSFEIGKYYESTDYISHSNTNKGIINKVYRGVRKHTIQKKIWLINSFVKGKDKSILDIGCGTGEFLNACKNDGWNAQGIEPSLSARKLAISNYGLTIHEEDHLKELSLSSFDVVTMWHVLEHVHELNARVEDVKGLLKDKGTAIIAVPNCASYDAGFYKEFWAGYDVPRHLYHFVPETMKLLFNNHGMEIVKQLPMKFDSYYVSMLSEKYKTGESKLISAFLQGLISNFKAGGDAGKFSSVIYIIKKSSS